MTTCFYHIFFIDISNSNREWLSVLIFNHFIEHRNKVVGTCDRDRGSATHVP